jgi:hypothetical protein
MRPDGEGALALRRRVGGGPTPAVQLPRAQPVTFKILCSFVKPLFHRAGG